MNTVAKKLSNIVKSSKSLTTENLAKGYIEDVKDQKIEGWINIDKPIDQFELILNGQSKGFYKAGIYRPDVISHKEFSQGKGFEIPLLPKDVADAYQNNKQHLYIEAQYDGLKLQNSFTFSYSDYFLALSTVDLEDINTCLGIYPLLSIGFLKYLDPFQLLCLLDNLVKANLVDVSEDIINNAILLLEEKSEAAWSEDLRNHLHYVLVNHQTLIISIGNLSQEKSKITKVCKQVINEKPLDQREMIAKELKTSQTKLSEKINLHDPIEEIASRLQQCGQDMDKVIAYWHSMDENEQILAWDQLANLICFFHQPHYLLSVEPKWKWFCQTEREATFESAIDDLLVGQAYKIPLVIRTACEKHYSTEVIVTALLKMVHNLDQLGWVPIDHVAAIFDYFSDDEIKTHFENLAESLLILINELETKTPRLLSNSLLIKTATKVINLGIEHHQNMWPLFDQCCKHFILNHEYLNELNFTPLNTFNPSAYAYYKKVFNNALDCLAYFNQITPEHYKLTDALVILHKLQSLEGLSKDKAQHFGYQLYHFCKLHTPKEESQALRLFENYLGAYDKLRMPKISEFEKTILENELVHSTCENYQFNKLENVYQGVLKARKEKDSHYFDKIDAHLKTNETFLSHEQIEELNLLMISECCWSSLKLGQKREATLLLIKQISNPTKKIRNHALAALIAIEIDLMEKDQSISNQMIYQIIKNHQLRLEGELIDTIFSQINPDSLPSVRQENALNTLMQRVLFPYCTVMVYSCQAYKNTRHKSLESTWISAARELDIDVRIVVGGVDKAYHTDHMIYLDVEDTYEALPQKSLRMFEYAKKHFNTEYFHKIDDDCLLNIYAHFSDPAYLGKMYWGRANYRTVGSIDRTWHQKKSQSINAKKALDLSPEESQYADGSTGYILSRSCVKKLLAQIDLKKSQVIIQNSYFEDKLIGDLLGLNEIVPENNNFSSIVMRNIVKDYQTIIWDYNILPSKLNKVKVLHTENPEFLETIWKTSFVEDKVDSNENFLISDRLINSFSINWNEGDEQPLVQHLKIQPSQLTSQLTVIMVGKNEINHWPASLEHHRKLGINNFIYIDNCSTDGSLEYMLKQEDVSVFIASQEYKHSRFSVNWVQAVMANYCIGQWVLILDADELFAYDDFENTTINTLIEKLEAEGANTLLSPMIDFYPKNALADSALDKIQPYRSSSCFDKLSTMNVGTKTVYGPFSNSQIFSGGLRGRVFGNYNRYPSPSYLNHKYCLFKYSPEVELVEGIHFIAGRKISETRAAIMHFKYHAGFSQKVKREIAAGQHWNGSKEYKRYLNALKINSKMKLYDNKNTEEYVNSKSLIETDYISTL